MNPPAITRPAETHGGSVPRFARFECHELLPFPSCPELLLFPQTLLLTANPTRK